MPVPLCEKWDTVRHPVFMTSISLVNYTRGLLLVTTDAPDPGTNGHLIIVNDIVCGDFYVEIENVRLR